MSKDTRNYYERELDLIDLSGPHPAKIIIGSEGKTTRALDINRESAVALIHRLTDFLLTPAPDAKEESAARLREIKDREAAKTFDRILNTKGPRRWEVTIP